MQGIARRGRLFLENVLTAGVVVLEDIFENILD